MDWAAVQHTFRDNLYADIEMLFSVGLKYSLGAVLAFYPAFSQGHIRDKHESAGWHVKGIADRKECGYFHVDGNNAMFENVLDKLLVKFPHPVICGVHDPGLGEPACFSDNYLFGNPVDPKAGKGRDILGQVMSTGSFVAYAGGGDHEIAYFETVIDPSAHPEHEYGFQAVEIREAVHDDSGGW